MKLFRKREPTKVDKKTDRNVLQMVTTYNERYYAWDGKLYKSDIVRACIRPKVKAIGKLVGKHIRTDSNGNMEINPEPYIKFLLKEPNPYMTGQQMQEKMANQLCINNNAFALKVRDGNGKVVQMYPIPCVYCKTEYRGSELYLEFTYRNGKTQTFPYSEIIHLRQDYNEDDIFGDSPAPALAQMMEVVGTIDQGIIKAIKNSGAVRWLLKFTQSIRPEDVKKNVEEFVKNYLSIESDTFGAAGVDAKADAIRIEPKDYVPNSTQMKETIDRIRSFFNTNEKIIQSKWTSDEWNAYYESEIEPVVIQMCDTYTIALFDRKHRDNNVITFESKRLICASLSEKLSFVQMVDRGAMLPNEWRELMNLPPIEGGDKPIRRLDTQVVNMVENLLNKITPENCSEVSGVISQLIAAAERSKDETQAEYQRGDDTEQL